MIDGTYEIAIDTRMGSKVVTVAAHTEGDTVVGEINAPIVGKQRIVGRVEGEDAFSAQGTIRLMLVGKIDYALHGQVTGNLLRATVKSSKGDFELTGTRVL